MKRGGKACCSDAWLCRSAEVDYVVRHAVCIVNTVLDFPGNLFRVIPRSTALGKFNNVHDGLMDTTLQ